MSRPLIPPTVRASTFSFPDTAAMLAAIDGADHLYARLSSPTVDAVESRLAALEEAEAALLVASGVAALHLALWSSVGPDRALLVQQEVYGGTDELVRAMPWPAPLHRAPIARLAAAAAAIGPGVIHVELPTNPALRLVDLEAVRAAAPHATLIVDATFASPRLLRPRRWGADLVVHSATKYLGGHHDLLAGVVAGDAVRIAAARRWRKILGPTLDAGVAARLDRSLETLDLRVERASASAAQIARFLAAHPAVRATHHPSLPDHPDAALARRLLRDGLGGGVLSFELEDGLAARRCLDRLRRFALAASLGGTHSLATWPAGVTHANVPADQRAATGAPDGLIRLSVGLEDPVALCDDLAQALRDEPAR